MTSLPEELKVVCAPAGRPVKARWVSFAGAAKRLESTVEIGASRHIDRRSQWPGRAEPWLASVACRLERWRTLRHGEDDIGERCYAYGLKNAF